MLDRSIYLKSLFCLICGFLSTLSLTPYSFQPFMVFFVIGIFITLRSKRKFEVLILGYVFSFGWFFFGLYWIGSAFLVRSSYFSFILPFAIIALPMFLSLFWGLAFYLSNFFSKKMGNNYLWFVLFFSLMEYVRGSIFEFPWLMPSYILASNKHILQGFSFLGSYSMNVVIITFFVMVLIIIDRIQNLIKVISFLLIPISLLIFLSILRYEYKTNIKLNKSFLISLIQPNISQKEKWRKDLFENHFENLYNLSFLDKNIDYKTRLIVWPETAFVKLYPKDKGSLEKLSHRVLKKTNDFLFTGLINVVKGDYYNSSILVNINNKKNLIYNKSILVPFGEYIPFRSMFPFLSSLATDVDFVKGSKNLDFHKENMLNFLPLICYEIIFENYIRNNVNSETAFIINITNDAWFGTTIGPHQHYQFSKIRAVEFGLPIYRVANSGITAIVDPYGDEVKKIELNERNAINWFLLKKLDKTFFGSYGNNIFIILLSYVFLLNIFIFKSNRKEAL